MRILGSLLMTVSLLVIFGGGDYYRMDATMTLVCGLACVVLLRRGEE